jgi:membrane protein DedA with SNARE-associated domain
MVFPPFPSDVIIIFEGYLTTLSSSFYYPFIFLNSVMGSIIGSGLVYWFGYAKGNEVLRYKIVLKYIDEKHIKRSENVFHKYGKYGLIISKFIPGTSSLMVLLSGIFRVKKRVYFTYIIISILVQQTIYMVVGRVIGHNMASVKKFLSVFNIASVTVILILALLIYIIYKIKKSKSKKETEQEQ